MKVFAELYFLCRQAWIGLEEGGQEGLFREDVCDKERK